MPAGSIDPSRDYIADLEVRSGKAWPTISASRREAFEVQELLYRQLRQFTSEDVDIVVFGSLARREWTSGSDVD